MEKKVGALEGDRFTRAREVLDQGLRLNPQSSCLLQAWGLLELQAGRNVAAIRLLDRATLHDPETIRPLLRWAYVVRTRRSVYGTPGVGARLRRHLQFSFLHGSKNKAAALDQAAGGMDVGTSPSSLIDV